MNRGGLKYFLLALIFGTLAAFGSFIYLNNQKAIPSETVMVDVPVAIEAIDAYEKLTASLFKIKKYPEEALPEDVVMDINEILGKYAASEMFSNEPVRLSRLRDHIDDVLPSVIKEGYRAISIMSDEYHAVSDLIVPGDHIDLLVFLPEKTHKEEIVREEQAQLFIQNVQVLSVSRITLKGQTAHEEVPDIYSLTLEVPVERTKDIVLAENIGVIEVVLRGKKDAGKINTPSRRWQDLQ